MGEFLFFFLQILAKIIWVAIFIRVLGSWFNISADNPLTSVLRLSWVITEPLLSPIRRLLPRTGMFDFSPIVLIIVLQIVESVAQRLIP